jgi:hypothetical protein
MKSFLILSCLAALSFAEIKLAHIEPGLGLKDFKPNTNIKSGSSLIDFPQNLAALVGSTVTFVCEMETSLSRVNWYELATSGNPQIISEDDRILPGHPNGARYSIVQATPTQFYLEIRNITLQDGGSYACVNSLSGPPNPYIGQAELVVIGANPNCSTVVPENGIVIEGQNYTTECSIYFRGGLSPFMFWTGPEPFQQAIITIPSDQVYSGIIFTIDRGMDTRSYRCTTNFTEVANPVPGVASNAPDYTHVFQAGQLFVYWGPKNMYAVPMKPVYQVGDQITCYADSFPPPFYQWQNMRTLEFFSSQIYTILPEDDGWNTTLRCQAQNLIQGFLYSGNLFIFADLPITTTPTTTMPTTPTTPPPFDAPCTNLSGWWISQNPYAELNIFVEPGNSGRVAGFLRNDTDQQWIEVIGRTRVSDWAYLGLTAIWYYDVGVTGFSGECHRCFGEERIISAGMWRSRTDSAVCGDGGSPSPYTSYDFKRISSTMKDIHHSGFKVKNPSEYISGRLGVNY